MQVNLSNGGLPKFPILLGKLVVSGLEGDRFAHPAIHGGLDQAILLIASEVIGYLKGLGYPVFAGALGENLTTLGCDPKSWRAGQRFRVGSARIELTKLRVPCRSLDRFGSGNEGIAIQKCIYDSRLKRGDTSADSWGRSGFYARVIQPGDVAAGDPIILESELA